MTALIFLQSSRDNTIEILPRDAKYERVSSEVSLRVTTFNSLHNRTTAPLYRETSIIYKSTKCDEVYASPPQRKRSSYFVPGPPNNVSGLARTKTTARGMHENPAHGRRGNRFFERQRTPAVCYHHKVLFPAAQTILFWRSDRSERRSVRCLAACRG